MNISLSFIIMSGDQRKHGPLNAFVTITKKPLITPSSSEQTEPDQSEIASLEVAQQIGTESEESENNYSSDMNQNLNILASHPDIHGNDIGFQLLLHTSLTNEAEYQLFTKPFRPDKKYIFPNQHGKNGTIRGFMTTST